MLARARTGDWINAGWNTVINRQYFWKFVLLALLFFVITSIINSIAQQLVISLTKLPLQYDFENIQKDWQLGGLQLVLSRFALMSLGGFLSGVIYWPVYMMITAAAFAVTLHLLRTGRFDFNQIDNGFQPTGQILLGSLVVFIFSYVALPFCFIPVLLVTTLYLFTLPLIFDRKMYFWDAMETSRKKVQEDFWGFLVFVLALAGINILGFIVCCVGLLVSMSITWVATMVAYRELWPEPGTTTVVSAPLET